MSSSTCDSTLYEEWYNTLYKNNLDKYMIRKLLSAQRSNKDIWRIMQFDKTRSPFLEGNYASYTNGQIMSLSSTLCRESLASLKIELSGSHGPVSDQSIHDEMCSSFCIINDELRNSALEKSLCTCTEMSILDDDAKGKNEQKMNWWCFENSAYMLCDELERCGVWKCGLDDFNCKRREFNQIYVPDKGYGHECSAASVMLGLNFDSHGVLAVFSLTLLYTIKLCFL